MTMQRPAPSSDCGPSSRAAPADRVGTLARGSLIAVLAIAVAALLLRLHNIDRWGMWIDELYSDFARK